jgi:hypothetical protein
VAIPIVTRITRRDLVKAITVVCDSGHGRSAARGFSSRSRYLSGSGRCRGGGHLGGGRRLERTA